jgi:hypothetical protein
VRSGVIAILMCAGALWFSGCRSASGGEFDIALVSGPSFSGHLADHPHGTIHVSHPGGGQVVETGNSRGTFTVTASRLTGALSKIPPEFSRGRYSEKFVTDRFASAGVEHYHSVAVLTFRARGAGSACILLNGVFNLGTGEVKTNFSVLGGTGEGGRIRMSGTARASGGGTRVSISGKGKIAVGAERKIPSECHGL